MTRHATMKKARRKLRDGEVARLYRKVAQEADSGGYTLMTYAVFARLLGLQWYFAFHDNAETIVVIREGLERLERLRLIQVKPDSHTTLLVRLCPRALQISDADAKSVRKLLELEAASRSEARQWQRVAGKREHYGRETC